MIDKAKRGSYLIKVVELEKKILELQKKMEENFVDSAMYFDLGIPVNKDMVSESDNLGAELNQAITDFRYYSMLLNESEDFSYMMN
jgi:hypothetical protein